MKLVAGGVSLVVLAVLAVVTTGFQADDIEPPSTESPASFLSPPQILTLHQPRHCSPAVQLCTRPSPKATAS